MIDTATWFGPAGGELFGWFCAPDSGISDYGVLLCSPIGEEEHNAHETLRRLAWSLAEVGIGSLRFDYHGTGDSAGRWSDPDRLAAWKESVRIAYDALTATGVPRIAGVGLRIGAGLLAASAMESEFDLAVLWDPCSGKSMLREGYARRPGSAQADDGSVDTPGYRYSPQTVEDLKRLDPAALAPSAHRTLVLVRVDRPPPRGLSTAFPPGPSVDWDDCDGMTQMLDVPMDRNSVAAEAIGQIVGWISRHARRADPCPFAVARQSLALTERPAVFESVVQLGTPGLLAILSEPERRTRDGFVVFINVATDRHTGPGRAWVESARSLAAAGFRCARLNQSATGDSLTPAGRAFGLLYSGEWLDELPAALVDPIFARERLALVSLCSGAYSALEAATRVPVDTVYAINVILTVAGAGRGEPLYDERRRVARSVNRAFLPWIESHPRVRNAAWRGYRQLTVWNAPLAGVSRVITRGTTVILIMNRDDARHFSESAFWSAGFVWRWRRDGKYRIVVDSRIDHPLMTQEGQFAALQAISADVRRRFPCRSVRQLGASL